MVKLVKCCECLGSQHVLARHPPLSASAAGYREREESKREREKRTPSTQSAGLMGRNECLCQSLINPIKELQQAGSNVLLARVPHKNTHGPMTIINKMLEAMTNVIKSRALNRQRERERERFSLVHSASIGL